MKFNELLEKLKTEIILSNGIERQNTYIGTILTLKNEEKVELYAFREDLESFVILRGKDKQHYTKNNMLNLLK